LQALVLMNDPTYLEAARKLAERVMLLSPSDSERVTAAFRIAVSRSPNDAERKLALNLYHQSLTRFQRDAAAAQSLLTTGESPRDATLSEPELAAWTRVMSVILNLDEAITKG
jgi:hypothetical protein